MALDALPTFTALPGETDVHARSRLPLVDDMERAYDDA